MNVAQTRIILRSCLAIWCRCITPDVIRDNISVTVCRVVFVSTRVWLAIVWMSRIDWRASSVLFFNSLTTECCASNRSLISLCRAREVSKRPLIPSRTCRWANILLYKLDARRSLSSSATDIEATACVIRRRLMVATWPAKVDRSFFTSSSNIILNCILRGRLFNPLLAMLKVPRRVSNLEIFSKNSRSGLSHARAVARMDVSWISSCFAGLRVWSWRRARPSASSSIKRDWYSGAASPFCA